jgi:hypothetical protein
MAKQHGIVIMPCRVVKPRDTALVENHVQNVERRLLAPLRDRSFVGLNDCNRAIWDLLADLNSRPFQKMSGSRLQMFGELDVPAFLCLPVQSYEYAQWTQARLGFNYHLSTQGCYYSAPCTLIKQMLDVRLTRKAVEILHDTKRVASHIRSYHPGSYTTDREHMPRSHREGWTPESFAR